MPTKSELEAELKQAMREGDKVRRNTLRMVLSAIKLAEVDRGEELGEEDILKLLQKEAKSRSETIEDAEKADRDDLIEAAQAELQVLEEFLPQPLTRREIEGMASEVIDELDASDMSDMGRVMSEMMSRTAGRAEGSEVSEIVRSQLQDQS
ncbi:MAG: GatB/YqeY domain-containing protein [Anaerolineales bacterium]|nr:GatB/YqeY domain-containing protein [Anaerolineales bacterium]